LQSRENNAKCLGVLFIESGGGDLGSIAGLLRVAGAFRLGDAEEYQAIRNIVRDQFRVLGAIDRARGISSGLRRVGINRQSSIENQQSQGHFLNCLLSASPCIW